MKQRIGAVSFLDLYRLRFRSKAVVSALAITCVVGLLFTTCAQITAGAKMFAAITGSNQYYLGLLLVIVITVIYTSTGGVKSMAKVAAIQGVVMLIATFSIMGILLIDNAKLYGSLGAAVEYMGTNYPEMLPSGVAGIIFCGVFAAIQSSLAGYCMSAAAFFAKDFFIDCVKPDMSEKKQKTFSSVTILVFAAIATLLALKPTDLTQFMINFALGALASAWYWPVLCGLYWKKATWKGTFWSCIGGFFAYMLFYILSSVMVTEESLPQRNGGSPTPTTPTPLYSHGSSVSFSWWSSASLRRRTRFLWATSRSSSAMTTMKSTPRTSGSATRISERIQKGLCGNGLCKSNTQGQLFCRR